MADATFDIQHTLDDCTIVMFEDLPRGEALEIIEERVCTGQMTGRRFKMVAVHQYRSLDGRAKVLVTRHKPTQPISEK